MSDQSVGSVKRSTTQRLVLGFTLFNPTYLTVPDDIDAFEKNDEWHRCTCLRANDIKLSGERKEAKPTEAHPVEPRVRPAVLDVGPELTLV